MSGIFGYVGLRNAAEVVREGLGRLEYRGYDSSGLAMGTRTGLGRVRAVGRLPALDGGFVGSTYGIGHLRWATHGSACEANAHPHFDRTARIALVHNGVIHNHESLATLLRYAGVPLCSDTDSEVLVHRISTFYRGDPIAAIQKALEDVVGSWGLGVLFADHPNRLFLARRGAPLFIGFGEREVFACSDVHAFPSHVDQVASLEDEDVVMVSPQLLQAGSGRDVALRRRSRAVGLGGGRTYDALLSRAIGAHTPTLRELLGRDADDATGLDVPEAAMQRMERVQRVVLTSPKGRLPACEYGAELFRVFLGVPVTTVELSQLGTALGVLEPESLVLGLGVSRAELRQACQDAGQWDALRWSVGGDAPATVEAGFVEDVVLDASMSRDLVALCVLAVRLAERRNRAVPEGLRDALRTLPERVTASLRGLRAAEAVLAEASEAIGRSEKVLVYGEGALRSVAAGAAALFNDRAGVESEAVAMQAEDPWDLLDEHTPVLFFGTEHSSYDEVRDAIRNARVRGAFAIVVHTLGDQRLLDLADCSIPIRGTSRWLEPVVVLVVMQTLVGAVMQCRQAGERILAVR